MPRLLLQQATELRDVLLSVGVLKNADERQLCLDAVHTELGRQIVSDNRKTTAHKTDLMVIVQALSAEPEGLPTLLRAAEAFGEPGDVVPAWRVLARLDLADLLDGVRPDVVAEVAGQVMDARVDVDKPDVVLQQVGWQRAEAWGASAMIAFVVLLLERLSGEAGGAGANPASGAVSGREGNTARIETWLTGGRYAFGLTGADLDNARRVARLISAAAGPGSNTGLPAHEEGPDVGTTTIIKVTDSGTAQPPALVWGGVPARNQYFVGRRESLTTLDAALTQQARASVLPKASVRGAGGVGKTQLAVEYTYLNQSRYQIIWWINAENIATVRASLSALADRVNIPPNPSMEQRIRALLDHLATTSQDWLLVYDNATDPAELAPLMPTANVVGELGHVIVTTRNTAWAAEGATLELDVFSRSESLELLQARVPDTTDREAHDLAEKLDDLPLALEQAASWLLTMPSSVDEYLQDLESRATTLLAEGRPREYNGTVLTVVSLALPQLAERSAAAVQLLELLVHLAPEPISTRLLWEGRRAAGLPEPLRSVLQERNDISRTVRHLGSLGLARIDNANKRVQIHRLVHLVVREGLTSAEPLLNAQRLLSAANPGFPDDRGTWPRHSEIAPHLQAAHMNDGDVDARRTVLDQVRYLYNTGDYESCRVLVEEALAAWDVPDTDGRPSSDALTLLALRRYGDALRQLNDQQAATVTLAAYERMVEALGEEHEYTMGAANSVGADMRRAGRVTEARELDARTLETQRRVLGDADPSTLRIMNSLAMDLRLTGDFAASYALNVEVEEHARTLEDGAIPIVLAQEAQARDLYLLGRYADAAALLEGSLPIQRNLLGADHLTVLRATCVYVASLRKLGRLDEAVAEGRANHLLATRRFGPDHLMTAECGMTAANALRARGDARDAHTYAMRSLQLFRGIYGEDHPLVWCASVNVAAILRARDLDQDAEELNLRTLDGLRRTLPGEHPYLLSARTGVVMNLVRAHRIAEAQPLSAEILADSQRVRGPEHAYTYYCMVNAAVDQIQSGQTETGLPLLAEATRLLIEKFGADHPEVEAARNRRRIECDIETISLI
ncbi:hypothetical protein HDA40_000146 [Hamadaea flava]|uniref:FxSxx-COOH system tetratricopeptide repeat protein n=1 Tax=Hamadaea flava TaxID=1742688 RepID=A0ABV8LX23_9ACTN|nr:FxSxx-COOH system tetratricopeptide repeat protein [Hamadaea flava]MCP2321639.1 hypothetical protein [Hamadaea flava]